MVSYATLCLRLGSRILGLRRQQIAMNDLEKKLESDFFSEMEKISHRIFCTDSEERSVQKLQSDEFL